VAKGFGGGHPWPAGGPRGAEGRPSTTKGAIVWEGNESPRIHGTRGSCRVRHDRARTVRRGPESRRDRVAKRPGGRAVPAWFERSSEDLEGTRLEGLRVRHEIGEAAVAVRFGRGWG
jgi:hypothetical protein